MWEDRSGRIDRSALEHVWRQIAEDLRADITSKALSPGAKLPSEEELAEVYGVARVSIRSAIASLRDEGLLVVMRGRGTFVAKKD